MPSWRRLVIAGLKPIKRKKTLIIEKEKKEHGKNIYTWPQCGSIAVGVEVLSWCRFVVTRTVFKKENIN